MSVSIRPLQLEVFEQLPKHARRCVFWEVDPQTLGEGEHLADPEFEKEAWLSMVMLEWGSCGQVATPEGADDADHDDDMSGVRALRAAAGGAAGPAVSHRTGQPPTRCCSPRWGSNPANPMICRRLLIAQVVNELVRRGVRALEAFGRTAQASDLLDIDAVDPDLAPSIAALGDCSFEQCMIDADFLLDVGFTVVAPHPYFPRLRLELDKGLGWKAEVEAALERLLESLSAAGGLAPLTMRAPRLDRRATVFHGLFVSQQFGEGEGSGGAVVLAQQVQPFHRGEDAFGDRVADTPG